MNKYKKIKTIALLSALTILATYLLNHFVFFISTMKDLLYSKNNNYYQWRFGKIFYTKQGQGSPMLLIHEVNHTSSDIEYQRIVDNLSKKHTVYTLDLLGCGRSDKPKITYTSYLYVQLINDFTKNVIGSKTHIIATGASTSIAIMACHADNSLYENILLINPDNISSMQKIPTARHKFLKYFLEFPIIGTLTYNLMSSKQTIKKQFLNNYYCCGYKAKPRYIHAYCEAAHLGGSSSKYVYASIKSHYTTVNILHAVKNINNSIYILMGQYEENGNNTLSQYLELNPAIESSTIRHTKHLPQLESPSEVLAVCDIFF